MNINQRRFSFPSEIRPGANSLIYTHIHHRLISKTEQAGEHVTDDETSCSPGAVGNHRQKKKRERMEASRETLLLFGIRELTAEEAQPKSCLHVVPFKKKKKKNCPAQ